MKKNRLRLPALAACSLALAGGGGCAMFRASTAEVDVNQRQHLTAEYDFTDMRDVTQGLVADLLNSNFLRQQPAAPVMMIAGVQNRTQQYADMKNLTDSIRTLLLQSGRVRFINETRRAELLQEQGYQAANATPETQVAVGRQLGARYMISGSFTQMTDSTPRQVRVSKQVINFYKLTFEITDLQSSEMVWTKEKEFARRASIPLIGW